MRGQKNTTWFIFSLTCKIFVVNYFVFWNSRTSQSTPFHQKIFLWLKKKNYLPIRASRLTFIISTCHSADHRSVWANLRARTPLFYILWHTMSCAPVYLLSPFSFFFTPFLLFLRPVSFTIAMIRFSIFDRHFSFINRPGRRNLLECNRG